MLPWRPEFIRWYLGLTESVEADLYLDGFLAAAAAESGDDAGERLVPAAAAMTRQECGSSSRASAGSCDRGR